MLRVYKEQSQNRIIIISEDIDLRVLYALRYSRTISIDIIVFGIFENDEDEQCLRSRWSKIKSDVPLVLRYSSDGGILTPLLAFLCSSEFGVGADEIVTVVLTRLVVTRWWHRMLHNQVSKYLERRLSIYKQINVDVVPIQLADDVSVLRADASS